VASENETALAVRKEKAVEVVDAKPCLDLLALAADAKAAEELVPWTDEEIGKATLAELGERVRLVCSHFKFTLMSEHDFVMRFRKEFQALREKSRQQGRRLPIPGCPDWTELKKEYFTMSSRQIDRLLEDPDKPKAERKPKQKAEEPEPEGPEPEVVEPDQPPPLTDAEVARIHEAAAADAEAQQRETPETKKPGRRDRPSLWSVAADFRRVFSSHYQRDKRIKLFFQEVGEQFYDDIREAANSLVTPTKDRLASRSEAAKKANETRHCGRADVNVNTTEGSRNEVPMNVNTTRDSRSQEEKDYVDAVLVGTARIKDLEAAGKVSEKEGCQMLKDWVRAHPPGDWARKYLGTDDPKDVNVNNEDACSRSQGDPEEIAPAVQKFTTARDKDTPAKDAGETAGTEEQPKPAPEDNGGFTPERIEALKKKMAEQTAKEERMKTKALADLEGLNGNRKKTADLIMQHVSGDRIHAWGMDSLRQREEFLRAQTDNFLRETLNLLTRAGKLKRLGGSTWIHADGKLGGYL
jgi:hypothetical protein